MAGSYTCQIFWKGDPSIENFIIRFTTEEGMKKWAQQIEAQRRRYRDRTGRSSDGSRSIAGGLPLGTSVTEFEFMRNQPVMENPYAREDDDEEDDLDTLVASANASINSYQYPYKSDFSQSRNGSQSSLRSRSTTGDSSNTLGMAGSTSHMSAQPSGRTVPPRLASSGGLPHPQLSLRTRELQQSGQQTPPMNGLPGGVGADGSYFSPTGESPLSSSRTSTSSNAGGLMMYPFPRQQSNGYYEEVGGGTAAAGHGNARFTAPAMARQRELSAGSQTAMQMGVANGYPPPAGAAGAPPGRGGTTARPPGAVLHSAQQMPSYRNRSASSPDIHNGPPPGVRGPGSGRGPGSQPPVPEMPSTYQQNPHMIPRSQSNSPNLNGMVNGVGIGPARAMNQSPQYQRDPRAYSRQQSQQDPSPTSAYGYGNGPMRGGPTPQQQYHLAQQGSRTVTPVPGRGEAFTPPPPSATPQQQQRQDSMNVVSSPEGPTQLKVKVHCPSASQTLTLVVPLNITYQSLKDRIDAKLQRSTNLSLSDRGPRDNQVKLKYLDEDDYVSIQSDEDVQTAFEAWRDSTQVVDPVGMGEIDLFCQKREGFE